MKVNTVGYFVTLRLPDHITPEEAQKQLGVCISFGQPSISLAWVLPDANDTEVWCVPDGCPAYICAGPHVSVTVDGIEMVIPVRGPERDAPGSASASPDSAR
jgi:hypothetical protein